mgnify:CR=1 FL=1
MLLARHPARDNYCAFLFVSPLPTAAGRAYSTWLVLFGVNYAALAEKVRCAMTYGYQQSERIKGRRGMEYHEQDSRETRLKLFGYRIISAVSPPASATA